jgi:hypothetical protein
VHEFAKAQRTWVRCNGHGTGNRATRRILRHMFSPERLVPASPLLWGAGLVRWDSRFRNDALRSAAELPLNQPLVQAVRFDECIVRSLLRHLPICQNHHSVSISHSGQAMGDDERRASLHQPV